MKKLEEHAAAMVCYYVLLSLTDDRGTDSCGSQKQRGNRVSC